MTQVENHNAFFCSRCNKETEMFIPESEVNDSGVNDSGKQNQEALDSCPTADAGQVGGLSDCSQMTVPDGGWGWVVLGATVLVLALTLGFPSCIGVFYTDLQTEFNASNTQTSWVPAIMVAMTYAAGPLCSMLIDHFGCRVTVMVGGLLSGLGMVVSALARTISDIYVTSAITGLGFCFSFQPSVTMLGHYFVHRRAFVNALSTFGTAVGLCSLPLIANFLLYQFGWRGSFLVMGGILLNSCVSGALMRPLHTTSGPNKCRQSKVLENSNNLSLQRERKGLKDSVKSILCDFIASLHKHMAFDLLVSNPRYRAYTVCATWITIGYTLPQVYLVPYATHHNMELDRAAFLLSILGLVNIAVRPTAAFILNLPRFRHGSGFIYIFSGAILVSGLSTCICGASASFEALLVYMIILGLSMSIAGSLLFTMLMNMVEMSRFPSALGFLCMLLSGAMLIGPPLAGLLVDLTGRYSYVFYACSLCVCSGSLSLIGCFYFLDRKSVKEKKKSRRSETCSGCLAISIAK